MKCFLDRNSLSEDINGIPIIPLKSLPDFSGILLISPIRDVENIYALCKSLGFENIVIGNLLKFIPFDDMSDEEVACFPPFGAYYSLYPDFADVDACYDQVLQDSKSGAGMDGIDLNDSFQVKLLENMNTLYPTRPQWSASSTDAHSKFRYMTQNNSFGVNDACVLHFILRIFNPERLIEVGCGYSSAVTMDTCEYYLGERCSLSFIEPYPQRFLSLIRNGDKQKIDLQEKRLQDIPLEFFEPLDKNDVLFIDSTHVSKLGSDVNHLFSTYCQN